jgi:hypothetical protein
VGLTPFDRALLLFIAGYAPVALALGEPVIAVGSLLVAALGYLGLRR